jgi:hypothetical protein
LRAYILSHAACHPCRLLPKFTPGRALLWGTILALWGTGAVVATTAKQLEISTSGAPAPHLHLQRLLFAQRT